MTSPTWLSISLAAVMIATAVYCAGHLIMSRLRHCQAEQDVDLMHVAMGIAMAGTLVAALDRRWNDRWGLLLAVFAGWFAVRGLTGLTHPVVPRRLVAHHLQHLLACGAMAYMLLGFSTPIAQASTPTSALGDGMVGMGGVSAGAAPTPTLALVLAVVLLCYAGWNVAEVTVAGPGAATVGAGRPVLAPRFAICCQIATSVTMSYMLLAT